MTKIVIAGAALVLFVGGVLYLLFRPGSGRMHPLTKAEISAILSENTVIGEWNSTPYRQFFMADGVTYYAPKGKRTTRGRWRVSANGNTYESGWSGPETNWEAFAIMRTAEGLAWVDDAGGIFPFKVLTGQQLAGEE